MPTAMESKFYVWARGRWREVCARSGRVQGAGKARFLFASGGRLHVARASRVLSGLRALADRKPTSVRDGLPLPQRRSGLSKRPRSPSGRHHRHCCCRSHAHSVKSPKDVWLSPKRTDAAIQASEVINTAAATKPAAASVRTDDLSPSKVIKSPKTRRERESPAPKRKRTTEPATRDSDYSSDDDCSLSTLNRHKRRERYKELIIDEGDVDLYRSYLLRRDPSFDVYRFDTDDAYKLQVFYRINPLVALRRCRRLERMLAARPDPQASNSQDQLSLKDFATKLGLRSVSDQESEKSQRYRMRNRSNKTTPSLDDKKTEEDSKSSDDTDKENDVRHSLRNRGKLVQTPVDRTLRKRLMVEAVQRNVSKMSVRSAASSQSGKSGKPAPLAVKPVTVVESSSSDSDKAFVKKPSFVAKRPPPKKNPMKFLSQPTKLSQKWCGSGREYSTSEDHTIVAFVSAGERARLVNGNRVWQELQEQYHRLTGSSRSWHSLRNRYLRYILPALGQLALPPADAARLRAAAAQGEIKNRKRSSAPNPLLAQPRVRSAWGARPRPPLSRDSPEPPSPPADSPEPREDSPEPPAQSVKPAPASARRSSPLTKRISTPRAADRAPRREGSNSPSSDASGPGVGGARRLLRSSGVRLPPPSSPPPFRAPPLPRATVRPRLRKLFNHNA